MRRATFLCSFLFVLAAAPPGSAAAEVSRFPAAGEIVWRSITARAAPRADARRVTVLRQFRSDYRPQIVLAIGKRRVGAAPATEAKATLADTAGAAALELVARKAGSTGNLVRVMVQADAQLVVAHPSGAPETYPFSDSNLDALAARVQQESKWVTAKALKPTGTLAPADLHLRGGVDAKPGRLWYKLNLPIRPFGTTGWVPGRSIDVRPTTHRVLVRRGARVLQVYRGARRIFRTRVAVGRPDRKTPLGSFYVAAKFRPVRSALVSAYALELSAPAGLSDFPGGGVVGIHGTPAVWSIGKAASSGCVRVRPAAALRLKRIVPLGTPVKVVR